jgi:hypothetical protein
MRPAADLSELPHSRIDAHSAPARARRHRPPTPIKSSGLLSKHDFAPLRWGFSFSAHRGGVDAGRWSRYGITV